MICCALFAIAFEQTSQDAEFDMLASERMRMSGLMLQGVCVIGPYLWNLQSVTE